MIPKTYVVGGRLDVDVVGSPVLPDGAATSARQDTGNASLASIDANIGAKADAAATTDVGTFSLIALVKRWLERFTVFLSRFHAALGQTTKAGSLPVVPASDWFQTDIKVAAAFGIAAGWQTLARTGLNKDIDTAADEEIWSAPSYGGPAIRSVPTVPQIHTIVSTSANDTAAGTGMRAVFVDYIDASYNRATTTVMMNGLTPVNLPSAALLLTVQGVSFGSGGTNAGNITITAATDGTIQGLLPAGSPATALSAFMVPAGYSAAFEYAQAMYTNNSAGAIGSVRMEMKLFGSGGWIPLGEIPLRSDAGSLVDLNVSPMRVIPEKTIVRFIGSSPTNNNSKIGVILSLLMRAN